MGGPLRVAVYGSAASGYFAHMIPHRVRTDGFIDPVSRPALPSRLQAGLAHLHLPGFSLCSGILFCYAILGLPLGRLGWGTAMDSTALHELVAQVRGTTAALAEAEKRVASFTAELAQQDRGAQPDAESAQPIWTPIAKRAAGWVPAG